MVDRLGAWSHQQRRVFRYATGDSTLGAGNNPKTIPAIRRGQPCGQWIIALMHAAWVQNTNDVARHVGFYGVAAATGMIGLFMLLRAARARERWFCLAGGACVAMGALTFFVLGVVYVPTAASGQTCGSAVSAWGRHGVPTDESVGGANPAPCRHAAEKTLFTGSGLLVGGALAGYSFWRRGMRHTS